MKQSKKKRSKKSKTKCPAENVTDNEKKLVNGVMENFALVSLEEVSRKGVETLTNAVDVTAGSSSSGSDVFGSSSNGSDVFGPSSCGSDGLGSSSCSSSSLDVFAEDFRGFKQKNKPKLKKVVARAGMVSSMLAKDYVRSTPNKSSTKMAGSSHESRSNEDVEQFLCSMLGEDCELSLAVVRDVLCQCGYNIEKALNILVELSASPNDPANGYATVKEGGQHLLESNDRLTGGASDHTSHSSITELEDSFWYAGSGYRSLSRVPADIGSQFTAVAGDMESELSQKVLESLFNMPTPKNAEHEPSTMNWRNIVKQMTSMRQVFEQSNGEQRQQPHAKSDEYQVNRVAANQHWQLMKSYYHKAATAYSNGQKGYASYLSEQGRLQSKRAQEADEKASQDIFTVRNKGIENILTIDLHGQHIKQAMRLLKLHLLFGAYVRSVKTFRVITGCGSHGVGKSKLKTSVIDLLKKEGIAWSEENRGTLLIRLTGRSDFSFLDSDNDGD